MGELERERQARRLSISPSHVRALMAAGALLFAIGFLIGLQVGRRSAPAVVPGASTPASEAELLELLARVEANAGSGGLEALTYPDALPEGTAVPLPEPDPATGGLTTVVAPGEDGVIGVGQALPPGWFVLLTHHRTAQAARTHQQTLIDRGQDAVLRERRTDGVADFEVLVGPLSQEQADRVRLEAAVEWPEAEVIGADGTAPAAEPDSAPPAEPVADDEISDQPDAGEQSGEVDEQVDSEAPAAPDDAGGAEAEPGQ